MTASKQEQYIELALDEEYYAIRIQDVQEIIRMQPITAIPGSPAHVKGVICLRGEVVSVIGLRELFGMPAKLPSKDTRIVMVKHAETFVGVIVDRIHKVTVYNSIQVPPQGKAGGPSGCLTGIGLGDDRMAGLLNTEQLWLTPS
ncbi:purine-binding chemotaxis protein CheW [Paenibacillus sp. UNCCL117]|uniref:chemotaxis protein CheW n=1 Tax=unclassified Paenibacillus TaxID=185978 RepID=UPI00088E652A|nr:MULTISPECIES: chemotaxis protein CheW [unclassified Paenibacillus]SDE51690.1 purine-binding chemotaxis protein CheW [Paenibacillus sp. cl123]SFW67095.1 purine-binding chemotaxis protein CheW [Paenibacillus sp. UNCCL117]